jgi:tetratricopeptide (TPR) repeat protein
MYRLLLAILLSSGCLWAQNSPNSAGNSNSAPPDSKSQESPSTSSASPPRRPNLDPPRSDRVNGDTLDEGQSSSKDTQIDLSPPEDDVKAHPKSSDKLMDVEGSPANADVNEFHPWNPHKAAKDVEVGDFYFKRKNYKAAEDRYREALYYKDNDAIATFRLAVCLEKLDRPGEAQKEYENYLKILPNGPEADQAKKAIDRLKAPAAQAKPAK